MFGEIPNFIKYRKKYWSVYMKTYVGFIVAGDIKSP
jgi:hypothetical protein